MYIRCSICLSGPGVAFETNIQFPEKPKLEFKIRFSMEPYSFLARETRTWGKSSNAVAAKAKPRTVLLLNMVYKVRECGMDESESGCEIRLRIRSKSNRIHLAFILSQSHGQGTPSGHA
jgi:hypothetical protein